MTNVIIIGIFVGVPTFVWVCSLCCDMYRRFKQHDESEDDSRQEDVRRMFDEERTKMLEARKQRDKLRVHMFARKDKGSR